MNRKRTELVSDVPPGLTWWAWKRVHARNLYGLGDTPRGAYDGRLSKACGMRLSRNGRELYDSDPVTPGPVEVREHYRGPWPLGEPVQTC